MVVTREETEVRLKRDVPYLGVGRGSVGVGVGGVEGT